MGEGGTGVSYGEELWWVVRRWGVGERGISFNGLRLRVKKRSWCEWYGVGSREGRHWCKLRRIYGD